MNNLEYLTQKLKSMYSQAEPGYLVTSIHLFGIKYANQFRGIDLNVLAFNATGKSSYGTEIRKGIKLAKFVEIK